MTIWIALAWTAVLLMVIGSMAIRLRATWAGLALFVALLALLTVSAMPLVGSMFAPRFAPETDSFDAISEKLFVAVWWLLIARVLVIAGQIALESRDQRHAGRLISDLVAAAIYVGAVVAVVDLVFGVSVTGIVATSGIIAIVLGLALQNTLGDLFSGVAIGLERPFNVGDIVLIEGAAEGRVIETNWRSTLIATGSDDVTVVPNSVVAKARITNKSAPSEIHRATVTIVLDPAVPPSAAIAMLHASALNAIVVPQNSSVSVVCTDLRGDGATYEVQFSIGITVLRDARSALLNEVARHARYNGIALARRDGLPLVPVEAPDLLKLLGDVPILQALGAGDRSRLAAQMTRHAGDTGGVIFTQGGSLAAMFVIAQGTFEVSRETNAIRHRLGTIGPGDYFGELALLTGTPNAATVMALTPFVAYEVDKAMIAPFLRATPEALQALEAAATKAQGLLDRHVAAQAAPAAITAVSLLDRIRTFFELRPKS